MRFEKLCKISQWKKGSKQKRSIIEKGFWVISVCIFSLLFLFVKKKENFKVIFFRFFQFLFDQFCAFKKKFDSFFSAFFLFLLKNVFFCSDSFNVQRRYFLFSLPPKQIEESNKCNSDISNCFQNWWLLFQPFSRRTSNKRDSLNLKNRSSKGKNILEFCYSSINSPFSFSSLSVSSSFKPLFLVPN